MVDVGTLFDNDAYTGLGGEKRAPSPPSASSLTISLFSPSRKSDGKTGVNAPLEGGGVGTPSGLPTSGRQFQIPPATLCRSKAVTASPASRRCRVAGAPEAPSPTTATVRRGANVWYFDCESSASPIVLWCEWFCEWPLCLDRVLVLSRICHGTALSEHDRSCRQSQRQETNTEHYHTSVVVLLSKCSTCGNTLETDDDRFDGRNGNQRRRALTS